MQHINSYVKSSERKIKDLEAALLASDKTNAYMMIIDALKDELELRMQQINNLKIHVDDYRKKNQELVQTVKLQASDIIEMELQLDVTKREIKFLEARVQELVQQLKITEADAYFARAQAVEEAANRTRMAPNKKRTMITEATELYRKSLELGRQEARGKIEALQKKI
jgi:hypothetical protein